METEVKVQHKFELFQCEGDSDYFVRHADWHDISAFGPTVEDAFREFGIAFQLCLETAKEDEEN